jgi:hypothetical protein
VHAILEIVAAIVAIALIISTVLFAVDIFVKGRRGSRIGFVFSAISLPIYFAAFADDLPSNPLGFRDIIFLLPGIHEFNKEFRSSTLILILLLLTYALRLGIYTRLFVIPAFTLTQAEYHSREQIASRANDLSAPVLAYLTFALLVTALIAGAYRLPFIAGIFLCIFTLLAYFASPYLRNLRRALLLLMVECRIFVLHFWLYMGAFMIQVVIFLGKLEMQRRRPQPGDELFFRELAQRMRRAERKIRAKIAEEHEQLRDLAGEGEGNSG